MINLCTSCVRIVYIRIRMFGLAYIYIYILGDQTNVAHKSLIFKAKLVKLKRPKQTVCISCL